MQEQATEDELQTEETQTMMSMVLDGAAQTAGDPSPSPRQTCHPSGVIRKPPKHPKAETLTPLLEAPKHPKPRRQQVDPVASFALGTFFGSLMGFAPSHVSSDALV